MRLAYSSDASLSLLSHMLKSQSLICLSIAPDVHLQRLDPSLLSQQALMEMFVEGFKDKARFQDESGNYTDIIEWPHVYMTDGIVTGFSTDEQEDQSPGPFADLLFREIGGSVNLQFLPISVETFSLSDQQVTGTIDTKAFGHNIKSIRLAGNSFKGSFDMGSLPQSTTFVSIEENELCGTLNLAVCPQNLEKLYTTDNHFEGSIDLDHLPEKLCILNLSYNRFAGSLNFHKLTKSLNYLNLDNNAGLYGALFTSELPPTMHRLSLYHVRLNSGTFDVPESMEISLIQSGTVDLTQLPLSFESLELRNCSLDCVVNLELLPVSMSTLSIAHNKLSGEISFFRTEDDYFQLYRVDISANLFSGQLDLAKLPKCLYHFNASRNYLSGCIDLSKLRHYKIRELNLSHNENLIGRTHKKKLPHHLYILNTDGTQIIRGDTLKKSRDCLGW